MSRLKSTLEQLYRRISKGRKLGLERVQAVCDKLGNPERSFEVVHIGGTNGKGSVACFTASMLCQGGGQNVGLFTSPHLNRFVERIQVNGEPIADKEAADCLVQVLDLSEDLTFFEVTTVAAFLAFRNAGVNIAVLEVGLGGRLDATNVVPSPRVAAITRVAYDHMEALGGSLRQIAIEKAGIIKPGCKVVTGKLHPDALAVVEQRVEEVKADLLPLGSAEPYPGAQLAYPRMAMFGTNLAVAVTIARELGVKSENLASGIEETNWPGRNELLHRSGEELTLLDCAHNPDAAVLLSHIVDATSSETVGGRRNVALLFGACADKNWKAMLARLEGIASHKVFVAPEVAKAAPPEPMAETFGGETADSVAKGLTRARELVGSRGLVVVTGSSFVVGPARAHLLGLPTDPQVDL